MLPPPRLLRTVLRLLAALAIACSQHAAAQQDCAGAGSPNDIMRCEEARLIAAVGVLDTEYRRLIRALHDDPAPGARLAMRTLIQAQREWARFRDDDCDAVYLARPDSALREWYRLRCKRAHTETRAGQIARFRAD